MFTTMKVQQICVDKDNKRCWKWRRDNKDDDDEKAYLEVTVVTMMTMSSLEATMIVTTISLKPMMLITVTLKARMMMMVTLEARATTKMADSNYQGHINHGLWRSTNDEAMINKAINMELEVSRLGTLQVVSDDETVSLGN